MNLHRGALIMETGHGRTGRFCLSGGIRWLSVAGLSLLLGYPLWAQDAATRPARRPIPEVAAQAKAMRLAQDIFAGDLRKARTPEEKAAVVAKVMQAARDSKADAPGQYVLYELARTWSVGAGDVETALAAIDEQVAVFDLDVWVLRLEALGKLGDSTQPPGTQAKLFGKLMAWIDESLAADRYDLANTLGQSAAAMARRSGNSMAVARAGETLKAIKEAETAALEVKQALTVLAGKPDDPQANLTVGRSRCLTKGDWAGGVPFLAKGADADLKSLAEKELDPPRDADKQTALGDDWWDLSLRQSVPHLKDRMKLRAGFWYRQCADKLAGLEKLKVEKRLAEMPAEVKGSETSPVMGPRELTLKLDRKVNMKLALIPAGKFMMGSPDSEKERSAHEGPQHEVAISKPFYMGIHEVTQEQYEQVMGKNPSNFKGAQNPVESVSWDDAVEFCKKLSAKTGKTVRLPTEAQWEYACRAGTKTPFHTGETISTDQANYNGNYVYGNGVKGEYRQKTTTVRSFKANAFGLYDMHGNVCEWCADWYDEKYYGNSPKADPTGPADGGLRVLRGGSWNLSPWYCHSAGRNRGGPVTRIDNLGFRVAVLAGVD